MKKLNDAYQQPNYNEVISEEDMDEFEIGQFYSGISDKKLFCKKCGSDKWIVGRGEYHTSIKCPNCKYEL